MASAQERLKLKRPCEVWSVKEQLCLASSVLKSGDQNWMSVSRSLKPFLEKDTQRPVDWFSQKACALQYAQLLENADTPKRKKRETSETIGESIVRRLTQERMAELSQFLTSQREEYQQLKNELNLLKSVNMSEEKLQKMWLTIEQEEREQEQKNKTHTTWLARRQKQEGQTPQILGFNIQRKSESSESGHDTLDPNTDEEEKKNKGGRSPLLTSLLKSPSPTTQIQSQTAQVTSPTIASLLGSSPKIPNPPLTQTVSPQLHQLVSTAIANATPERPSAGAPTLSMLLELPANLQRTAQLSNLQSHTSNTTNLPQQNVDVQLMQIDNQRGGNIQIIEPPIASGNISTSEIIDHIDEVIPKDIMADVIDKDEINEIIGDIEELIKGEIPDNPQVLDPGTTTAVIDNLNLPQSQLNVTGRREIKNPQETVDSLESKIIHEKINSNKTSNIDEIIGTVESTKFISHETKSGDEKKFQEAIATEESKNEKSLESKINITENQKNLEIVNKSLKNEEQTMDIEEEEKLLANENEEAEKEDPKKFKMNEEIEDANKSMKEETLKSTKEEVNKLTKEVRKTTKEEVKKNPKEEIKKNSKEEAKNIIKEEIKKISKDEVKKNPKEEVKKLFKDDIKKNPKEEVKKPPKEDFKKNPIEEVKNISKEDKKTPTEEVKKVLKEDVKKILKEEIKISKEEAKKNPKEEIKKNPKEEVKKNPKEEVKNKSKEEIKKNPKEEITKNTKEELKKNPKEELKKYSKEEVKKISKEEPKKNPKEEIKKTSKEETKKPNKIEAKKPIAEDSKKLNETKKHDETKNSNEEAKKDSCESTRKEATKNTNEIKENTKLDINEKNENLSENLPDKMQNFENKNSNDKSNRDHAKEKIKSDDDKLKVNTSKIDQNTEILSVSSNDTLTNEDTEKSQDISLILEDEEAALPGNQEKKKEKEIDNNEKKSSSSLKENVKKEKTTEDDEETQVENKKLSKEIDNIKLENFKREDTKDSSDGTSNTELLETDMKDFDDDEEDEQNKSLLNTTENTIRKESKFNEILIKKEDDNLGIKEENDVPEEMTIDDREKNSKIIKEEIIDEKKIHLDDSVRKEQAHFSGSVSELDEEESSLSKLSGGRGVMKTYSKRQTIAIDSEPEMESSEGADYRAWKKAVMLVYNRLATHKYASAFLRPITEDQAPGYHSIIFRPMDLSTIKKNIDNGTIRSTRQFQRDVMLMFQNAIMYNKHDTFVYKMAITMQEECLQHMQILVQVTGEVSFRRETRTAASTSNEASESNSKRKRSHITPSPHDTDHSRGKKRRKSEND
ncbi:bromodomain-containing protein 8-like [Leptopilina boulardi]|uniref:bromodomain-containing protein 8-like n=1 Tax=Leptopilina boulardi TaxID=63433 RepID=UPI0021F65826|nr:bromodomain-containing protein 8-like [Leptopilina boulardi]